jgi:hypothetical protein
MSEKVYNITQAAQELNLTPFYVRKCIKAGKIQAEQRLIENTSIMRYEISAEALEEFASREKKSVGKRDDNRNKYTLYATKSELIEIMEALATIGFEHSELLMRANPPKNQS